MALGVFILCGCFNITRVEITCMATRLPYKTTCVSIINVLAIDSLCYRGIGTGATRARASQFMISSCIKIDKSYNKHTYDSVNGQCSAAPFVPQISQFT